VDLNDRRPASPGRPAGDNRVVQPPEHDRYARWLSAGTRLGLLVVVLGFGGYVTELWPAAVPPSELAAFWGQPASALAAHIAAQPASAGWPHSDTVAWWGIAGLATVSVPALLVQVPAALRRGDRALAALCGVAASIIVWAALGGPGVG
jgi:hypothetical protein